MALFYLVDAWESKWSLKKNFYRPPLELTYHELIERWGLTENGRTLERISEYITFYDIPVTIRSMEAMEKYQAVKLTLKSKISNNKEVKSKLCLALNLLQNNLHEQQPFKPLRVWREAFYDGVLWQYWLPFELIKVLVNYGLIEQDESDDFYSVLSSHIDYEVTINSPIIELVKIRYEGYAEELGYGWLSVDEMTGDNHITTLFQTKLEPDFSLSIKKPEFVELQLYFAYADIMEFEQRLSNKSSNDESRSNDVLKSVPHNASSEQDVGGAVNNTQKQRELVLKVAINLGVIKKSHTKAEVHEILKQASPELFIRAKATFNDFFKKQQLFTLNSGRRSMEDTTEKH